MKKHPLLSVMLIAAVLRGLAVIFSRGFMASDDHYETVRVAYNWLIFGLWHESGVLTWRDPVMREISRFPLYTLSLYAVMKTYLAFGVESLDKMMYGIRAGHALLSLITVACVYKITEQVTKSRGWAAIAGLIAAAHAAMPFLSVRNLIEVVSGHFWILSLLLIYRFQATRKYRTLLVAGMVAGLSWMIRFEIAFAILPVPFVLWFEHKRFRPAVVYAAAVGGMLLISAIIDQFLIGSFAVSTVNHIRQVLTEQPPYLTHIFIYPAVLLAFFLPPLSPIAFYLAVVKRFWSQHRILFFSSLLFVLAHTLSPSRQERYMIPILPALLVLLVLAFWWYWTGGGFFQRHRKFTYFLLGIAAAANLLLLGPLTVNYGHKGVVEPMVQIERAGAESGVVFVSPEDGRIYPYFYAGYGKLRREYIYAWSDLTRVESYHRADLFTWFVIYPLPGEAPARYVDSLESHYGPLAEWSHVGPSTIDGLLNLLNPKYNRRHDVWVYRLAGPG